MLRIASGVVVVMMLIGCTTAPAEQPASPAAPAPTSTPAADPAADPAPGPASVDGTDEVASGPPASQVVCHLDCSGQERNAYGATEEQARAAAQQLVEATCRPEDGQFFIFCEPAPAE